MTTAGLQMDLYRCAVAGTEWSPRGNPIVPAGVIRNLTLSGQVPGTRRTVHPKGVQVRGITIDGPLDFEDASLSANLRLADVIMDSPLVLTRSRGTAISITESRVVSVLAESLRLHESLTLTKCEVGLVDLNGSTIDRHVVLWNSTIHAGFRVAGSTIGGQLRGQGATFSGGPFGAPIYADNCRVHQGLFLNDATVTGQAQLGGAHVSQLTCSGATFTNVNDFSIMADDLHADAGVYLDDGFVADGGVRLVGAEIGGDLSCRAGHFAQPGGHALLAESIRVGGMVFMDEGFLAEGEVRLTSARVEGKIACIGGAFQNAGGFSLNAAGTKVGGAVDLASGFSAQGEVRFSGSAIGGDMYCLAGTFSNPGGDALNIENAFIAGSVVLEAGFSSHGRVTMKGSNIGGQLGCRGAHMINQGAIAFSGDGLSAGAGAFLDGAFHSDGEVSLAGASVPILRCDGGRFVNPDGLSLNCDKLNVLTDASLCEIASQGQLRLSGARVGGQLALRGALLSHKQNPALIADGIRVGRDIVMDKGFTSNGEVRLLGASVGGQVSCREATFAGTNGVGLNLHSTQITGTLSWHPGEVAPRTLIDLRSCSVGLLQDNLDAWPAPGLLLLDGFTYGGIDGEDNVERRIEWVATSLPYRAQPYEQLARWYASAGRDTDAKRVGIANQKARNGTLEGFWRRAAHGLWGASTAYGYRPALSLVWFVVAMSLATLYFWGAAQSGVMQPTDLGTQASATECTEFYPCFQPGIYAADVMIPIVDLGQREYWRVDASHEASQSEFLGWATGRSVQIATLIWIAFGWTLTAALVASIGQTISRS